MDDARARLEVHAVALDDERADGDGRVAGAVEASIAEADRGEGGFGYDSLFIPREGDGRTFAAMSALEKNELSHRGRALGSMVEALSHAGRR